MGPCKNRSTDIATRDRRTVRDRGGQHQEDALKVKRLKSAAGQQQKSVTLDQASRDGSFWEDKEIRILGSEAVLARAAAQGLDKKSPEVLSFESGAPDRIRTCDPLLRRQVLYPTELRALSTTQLTRSSAPSYQTTGPGERIASRPRQN